MEPELLRGDLIRSLGNIYRLEAFSALEALLQGESQTLLYLAEHREAAVYPSDLSRDLRLSRSRITGTLAALRRKGLLAMEASQEDRRRIRVNITEAGLVLILGQLKRMETYFDRMLAGLGRDDAKALITLIDRCVAVMEE
ncbi:MAG: MarR family transcriptional regulator [Oscillibacter sp.]